MGSINTDQQSFLTDQFDKRVNFDHTERKLYGHDIAAIPRLVQPIIGNTTPDGVVQPENEAELVTLIRWANAELVPLTPRGKATSGYGGAIPVQKGLVVDFYRMKDVLTIDEDAQTVTVEPGITWEQLDKHLKRKELTLRLYPTSYMSSSVGGWLAQGGAGIGSYEYGYFAENVVSARVVLPTGDVREFAGNDLDLISEAEGITGFISQVTLRVQPLEDIEVVALACDTPAEVQNFAQAIIDADLPIWSLIFINPRMAELKNKAPVREHNGHPVEEHVTLPNAYVLTVAFRAGDTDAVVNALPALARAHGARFLDDQIAKHEWANRFKLMIIKRLGPSLVPTEVVVPLRTLGAAMTDIENLIEQPLVKEAVVIRDGPESEPEVVILGFIPADQRKLSYNFVFGLALSVIRIAEKHGGRPYSTGMYFTHKANKVLGRQRANRLRAFKQQVDPNSVMNPRKVLDAGPLGALMRVADTFEPLIRPFGNHVDTEIGERATKQIRDIPADVAWYAYACSQCGYCIDECDQFYGRGWESQSPRGKWYWLREYMEGREEWDQKMVDTFLSCTTCELCNLRCSAALPIEPSWMKLRGQLIEDDKRMTFPPFEMMSAALEDQGNIWAGYRKDRSAWFPEDLLEKHGPGTTAKHVYFAGCTASYVENDIGMASVRLLDEAGVDFTYLGEKENCCATPMLVAGKWELFAETMQQNIDAVKAAGADTVVSSCPACDMMWRNVYPQWAKKLGIEYDITAKHYSEVISDKIAAGEFAFPEANGNGDKKVKVTWHDSCHIGRASGVYEPPRDMIKALPNVEFVEMAHNREQAHCCGSVLSLLKEPDVAADLGEIRLQEAVDAEAETVLALCPCCEFQLRVSRDTKQMPLEVVDLARFSAGALGYDFPEPDPEVRKQWAVFEAMIQLMTPEGFADLMGTMWPELVDAMPYGMGRMMRAMGHVPGALDAMKPMFPVLFPRLMPMMMPNLMPTLLDRVEARIPMPDYMREQMPDLMPKVMDSLMPHMLPEVVPLVTDPLVTYLQNDTTT